MKIKCPECYREVEDMLQECPYCGCPFEGMNFCPECGKEVDIDAVECSNCGCPLKKQKTRKDEDVVKQKIHNKKSYKKIIVIIMMVLILAVVFLIYYYFIDKGSFEVSLEKDTIELGDTINLTDCISYNLDVIQEVEVIDDDNFNSDKTGDYLIIYSVTNKKGNIKEISFPIHVIDTVAPEVSVLQDVVYTPKGSEYNPVSNVKITEKDKYNLDVAGDYDLNNDGSYEISFVAIDDSGNVSEKKSMTLIVEDRDDYVVRNIKFGDNEETIARYEKGVFVDKDISEEGNFILLYEDIIEGEKANIIYYLNQHDELYDIMILFIDKHTDYSIYINSFYALAQKISDKFGEPAEENKYKGQLYYYCDTEADALFMGQIRYATIWNTDDMDVYLYLSKDNLEVDYALMYRSKIVDRPDDSEIN